jgi:hypothetical protein
MRSRCAADAQPMRSRCAADARPMRGQLAKAAAGRAARGLAGARGQGENLKQKLARKADLDMMRGALQASSSPSEGSDRAKSKRQ